MNHFDRIWNREPASGRFDDAFWSVVPKHFGVRQFYQQFDSAGAIRFTIWSVWDVQHYNAGPRAPQETGRLVFGGVNYLFGEAEPRAEKHRSWFALDLSASPANEAYVLYRAYSDLEPLPAIQDYAIGSWSRLIDRLQAPLKQPILSPAQSSSVARR